MKEKVNVTGVLETMKIRSQFLTETGPVYQIAKSAMDACEREIHRGKQCKIHMGS